MKGFLTGVFVCFLAATQADSIDDYVKGEMDRLHIPALTFCIVSDGKVVRTEALGQADPVAKVATKADDLFEIGSITKQFTALCVMKLVEQNRIKLEDQVSKYLADIPQVWKTVKVRNLLNQNSGLPEYALVPGIGLMDKFDRKTFIETLSKVPMDFAPGEAWAYSNTNYALLGWIIEQVTGEPYSKFLVDTILKPTGMSHTSIAEAGVDVNGLAKGYIVQGKDVVPCPRGGFSIKSDGALVTNLADMVKWDAALRNGELVKPSSYRLLWGPGRLNNGRTRAYGMGWFLNMPGLVNYMGHGGNDAGYSAGFSRYPKQKLSVIMLCSLYPVGGEAMTKAIAELYDPALKPASFKQTADPNSKRTERVKQALLALATSFPNKDLLEPEVLIPLNSSRTKQFGPGPWGALQKIDTMEFGGSRRQGRDTWLFYRVTSGAKNYIVRALWSDNDKFAQGTIYAEPVPIGKSS